MQKSTSFFYIIQAVFVHLHFCQIISLHKQILWLFTLNFSDLMAQPKGKIDTTGILNWHMTRHFSGWGTILLRCLERNLISWTHEITQNSTSSTSNFFQILNCRNSAFKHSIIQIEIKIVTSDSLATLFIWWMQEGMIVWNTVLLPGSIRRTNSLALIYIKQTSNHNFSFNFFMSLLPYNI